MRWLRKGRSEEARRDDDAPVCEHIELIPQWDRAEDMGHDDRATRFRCNACGARFSRDEAEALRRSEGQRVQRRIAS